MSLPRFSVHNKVLVNMMMILILFVGAATAFTLTREIFPESRPDKILVSAFYAGVQPQEMEKGVTIKIEEAVHDIEGVEKVDSTTAESLSTVIVTLYNNVDDVNYTLQEIQNAVDSIEDLPDDLDRITVTKLLPELPVISVALFGEGEEIGRKRAARSLRDDLLALDGISDVQITGIRDDEISIEIRPERLLEYDITFSEVATAIRQTNLDVSGGTLRGSRNRVSVRTLGEELHGADLKDIVISSTPDGRKILLSDVANIRDEFIESDLETYFNGSPAVNCVVYKTADQDAIQIATLVKAFVAGKQNTPFDPYGYSNVEKSAWYWRPVAYFGSLSSEIINKASGRPDPLQVYNESSKVPFDHNYQVALHTDLARFVEGRLDLLLRNGKTGLILVLISLNLFLNWRVAFWAAIGLPVSFLGTFIVMTAMGATINLLTMFGLIIVLGIIVDDAIVIGENIFRHVEEGMPPMQAAIKGAEEVMWPVIVAVFTTIGAFAPLFFVQGQIGDFMSQLPLVVLAALSVSLIEALAILPAHLSHLPKPKRLDELEEETKPNSRILRLLHRIGDARDNFIQNKLLKFYEHFLRFALRNRYATIATAVATLIMAGGMVAGGIVEQVFIQDMDSETLLCNLDMPDGTTGDQVKQRLLTLSELVMEQPETLNVQLIVGSQYPIDGNVTGTESQPHLGQLIIELHPSDVRDVKGQRSSDQLMTIFRKKSDTLPGIDSASWIPLNGGPGGKNIHIVVAGTDFDQIYAVSQELKEVLREFEGVYDLDDDFGQGKREVQLRLRDSARPLGVTVGMLGQHVRSAMFGHEARRLTRNREDVKIMVRYPENYRKSIYNVESMWVPTPPIDGKRGWVPLGELAEITEEKGFSTIQRSRRQRCVTVYGEIDNEVASTSEIMAQVSQRYEKEIKSRYPNTLLEFRGTSEEMSKSFSSLKIALPVALVTIYVMLAGLFRSYLQPIVVMSAIPFGFQGAVIGHWMTGNPLTFFSAIGLVALTGILVNDSLVLVDFINSRVRKGFSHFEATVSGACLRLRAILLTTVTTVAGLTPLMFETSFQAKFLIPMAVTLTFGLMFATALTLVIVPAINLIFYDFLNLVSRASREEEGDLPATPEPGPVVETV